MIGVACAVALIGGALAQEQTPAIERPTVRFDAMPDAQDFARNYPPAAQRPSIDGIALLCCTIRPDRKLDCGVAYEWPENYGFGQASRVIAREFSVFPESYRDAQAAGDLSVRRTIRWVMRGTPRGQASQANEAAARARMMVCPSPVPAAIGR
jgi:hypothetical protein